MADRQIAEGKKMHIGNNSTKNLTGCTVKDYKSNRTNGRNLDSYFAERFAMLAESEQAQESGFGAEQCLGQSSAVQESYGRMAEESPEAKGEETDPLQYIRDYMDEIFNKIKKNECEPTFQIGAQSFTEKEWERFMKRFDSVEEAIKAAMKEAHGEETVNTESTSIVKPVADEWEEEDTIEGVAMAALCSETTKCSYPVSDAETEEKFYITWYTEQGIFCREQGQTEGYLWCVQFTEDGQYDRVLNFLKKFEKDGNLRFASHENFWQDYLAGKIDEKDFLKFFSDTENGIPNYTVTADDATYIDREKIKYAPYMNSHGNRFHTAEDLLKMQGEVMRQNRRFLQKY